MIFQIGSNTHDSSMTQYKTFSRKNIFAPPGAQKADVWVTANIGGLWTSGTGQFDDFSITTISTWPSQAAMKILFKIFLGISLILPVPVIVVHYLRQKYPPQ
jgi:hypothetical protein